VPVEVVQRVFKTSDPRGVLYAAGVVWRGYVECAIERQLVKSVFGLVIFLPVEIQGPVYCLGVIVRQCTLEFGKPQIRMVDLFFEPLALVEGKGFIEVLQSNLESVKRVVGAECPGVLWDIYDLCCVSTAA